MSSIRREEEPHGLRLELPAAHSAGRMARQMLRQFALKEGLPEEEVDRVEFIAGELLDNAVDHGGGNAAREESDLEEDIRMSIRVAFASDSWTIGVEDQGGGDHVEMNTFLQAQKEMPDLEDERGRGFFLILNMVDEIGVERSDDGLGLRFQVKRSFGDGA
ncbi:MAG: anti-sigma regulatory factor (Ser/Thr protein kinase) [Chlamydiales bacterium]